MCGKKNQRKSENQSCFECKHNSYHCFLFNSEINANQISSIEDCYDVLKFVTMLCFLPAYQLVHGEEIKRNHLLFQSTTLTQFWLPNSLGTEQEHEGSFSHLPSMRKRYSYLPGIKERVVFQTPFLSFFIE